MTRSILIVISVAAIVLPIARTGGQPISEIHGVGTNGLEPNLIFQKYSGPDTSNWTINVDLLAQTNFEAFTWLKIVDRSGARLRLWLTNGTELTATGPNALASNTPAKTAVSNILDRVYRRYRGGQWWPGGQRKTTADERFSLSAFNLRSVFDIPFTNDVVLQVVPLIYRVDTNQATAHLVEFPAIKLKLKANGDVEKLE